MQRGPAARSRVRSGSIRRPQVAGSTGGATRWCNLIVIPRCASSQLAACGRMEAPRPRRAPTMKRFGLFATSLLLASTVHAQSEADPKFSPRAEQEARTRWDAIAKEARLRPAGDWTGESYAGDGLGVNITLALAPQAGFVFEWRGDVGDFDRNFGSIETSGSRIALPLESPTSPIRFATACWRNRSKPGSSESGASARARPAMATRAERSSGWRTARRPCASDCSITIRNRKSAGSSRHACGRARASIRVSWGLHRGAP